jgi:hypothetical protein
MGKCPGLLILIKRPQFFTAQSFKSQGVHQNYKEFVAENYQQLTQTEKTPSAT